MNYLQQLHIQAQILGILWFTSQLRTAVSTPPPGYVKKPDTDLHPPKYEFGYEIRDGGGGQQGHLEARDGIYALGKYYVRLPNGSDQKVNYFADDWGYHPLVEYNSASPSSSSSTQFAMGEKAVAALVKTLTDAKPTEVSNILQRLSHKEVSSPSSGVSNTVTPPGSLNSLASEVLDSTLHVNSPSTASPYPRQQTHLVTITAETPTTQQNSQSVVAPSLTTSNGQLQTLDYYPDGDTKLTSPQYTTVSDLNGKTIPQQNYLNFESKKYKFVSPQTVTSNYVDETLQDTTQRVVTIGGNSGYKPGLSSTDSRSFSRRPDEQKGSVQITSYLANNEAAIDVSSNGEAKRLSGVQGHDSGATTISAFLIAEDERKVEFNEIGRENQQNSVTTTSPIQKEPFGPIIVTNRPSDSSSGYYEGRLRPTTEASLFSDELNPEQLNRIHSYIHYNNSQTENNDEGRLKSSILNAHDITPTPAPTPEPVLVTPREEASQLTSSDQVLAPIQAGVSLSASTSRTEEDSVDRDYDGSKISETMEPVVEQQTVEEQSVYKTTIDVQKSIPFEIMDNNYENKVNGQVEIRKIPSTSYQHGTYLPIHQSINVEFSKNNAESEQNLAHNKQQFLQQVLLAYQKLSNSRINEGSQLLHVHTTPIPITPTPIPNNLYYIYLQRYNPMFHRYGVQPQPQPQPIFYQLPYQNIIPSPSPTLIPNGYDYNNIPASSSYSQTSTKFLQDPGVNMGFSTYINHGGYVPKFYAPSGLRNTNNVENAISGYHNDFGLKLKQNIPQKYKVEVIKDETKIEPGISQESREITHSDSEENNFQVNTNENNNQGYLNGPVNTIYANNLNTLSSSTYQKYVENSEATTETIHSAEGGSNNYDDRNGQRVNGDLSNIKGQGVTEQMDISYQREQYSNENAAVDNSKLSGFEYTVRLPNPTAVTQLQLKVHDPLTETKVVPVAYQPSFPLAQPVALPHPQASNFPGTQYLPYPQVIPLSYKQYQPLYVYSKKENADHQPKRIHDQQQPPPFRPSQKLYHSVYPPETYYVTEYLKTNSRSRGLGKKLCIEYGGFKPPLVPSVQIEEKFEQKLEKKSDKAE
ncbi:uncharacterized protein LOC142318887 [Lycorma delicatula]|uniref:uncharacterized protein LOC142318887 n=1 Tax=Lycorma delicatula TaxID=130591 RepID=UPI003F51AA9C